jgi:hypothetical protein
MEKYLAVLDQKISKIEKRRLKGIKADSDKATVLNIYSSQALFSSQIPAIASPSKRNTNGWKKGF